MKVFFLACILLLSDTSVQLSLDIGQNLELHSQHEKLIAEKIKVLQLDDKDDSNSTDQDFRYTDVIKNDGYEESDHKKEEEDEKEEEGEDWVDEELEQRDRDMMMLAVTGGENDVGSFFGSLKMEADKKSLVCKYKCDGQCYHPHQQQCCKKKIVRRPWRCCPHSCGNVCFDSKTKQCCKGKVTLKSQNCAGCANKCGRRCFNPSTNRCCLGNVKPKNFKVCGRRCFNPSTNRCCLGNVKPKNFQVCGRRCFNPRNNKCCNGQLVSKNTHCISGLGPPLRITQGLTARRIGCFKDTWNRAIPSLEKKSYILTGNYQKRPFAIEKCALAAAKRGWSVFAVQHQGWCASSPTAGRTYSKYGRSNTCRNGKGGPWGNDVYVLQGRASKRTTSGDICVFPFIYKGKLYSGCTRVDHNRPWCAITPNYDVDKLWGNC